MLLTSSCGNTNIVFALYDGNQQLANWRISTDRKRSGDEYFVWLTQLMVLNKMKLVTVTDVIMACVVPEVQPKHMNFALPWFQLTPMIVGEPILDLGIEIRIDQ